MGKKTGKVAWDVDNDRKLLICLIDKSAKSYNSEALSELFEGATPKAIEERIAKLKREAKELDPRCAVPLGSPHKPKGNYYTMPPVLGQSSGGYKLKSIQRRNSGGETKPKKRASDEDTKLPVKMEKEKKSPDTKNDALVRQAKRPRMSMASKPEIQKSDPAVSGTALAATRKTSSLVNSTQAMQPLQQVAGPLARNFYPSPYTPNHVNERGMVGFGSYSTPPPSNDTGYEGAAQLSLRMGSQTPMANMIFSPLQPYYGSGRGIVRSDLCFGTSGFHTSLPPMLRSVGRQQPLIAYGHGQPIRSPIYPIMDYSASNSWTPPNNAHQEAFPGKTAENCLANTAAETTGSSLASCPPTDAASKATQKDSVEYSSGDIKGSRADSLEGMDIDNLNLSEATEGNVNGDQDKATSSN